MLMNIPDSSFSASSERSLNYAASRSRLRETHDGSLGACWSADVGVAQPWIQADLLHSFQVGKVATQRRTSVQVDEWVTRYTLSHGLSESELRVVLDEHLNERIFEGNDEGFAAVEHLFTPVLARFVRLTVQEFHGERASLRWDLYACFAGEVPLP